MALLFPDASGGIGAIYLIDNPYSMPAFIELPDFDHEELGCVIETLTFRMRVNHQFSFPFVGIPYFYVFGPSPCYIELVGFTSGKLQLPDHTCKQPQGIQGALDYFANNSIANLSNRFRVKIYTMYFVGFFTEVGFQVSGSSSPYLTKFALSGFVHFDSYA